MRSKIFLSSLFAAVLSTITASACLVQVRVACPNDNTASGIKVCIAGSITGCAFTDPLGIAVLQVPNVGNYTVCVDDTTLPAGAKISPNCQNIKVVTEDTTFVEMDLSGDFCGNTPPPGGCWMTGGGTLGKGKTPDFSYGGVVYPGCSPKAADGGNWNVIDHNSGLHFSGQQVIVDGCSGDPTASPKVNVRIIDFHGTGIISGIGGNPQATIPVTFTARAVDNHDGGAGADQLFLIVTSGANTLMQIGASVGAPATISTGNIQIHQSSCGN
jgi:hypothetical protein